VQWGSWLKSLWKAIAFVCQLGRQSGRRTYIWSRIEQGQTGIHKVKLEPMRTNWNLTLSLTISNFNDASDLQKPAPFTIELPTLNPDSGKPKKEIQWELKNSGPRWSSTPIRWDNILATTCANCQCLVSYTNFQSVMAAPSFVPFISQAHFLCGWLQPKNIIGKEFWEM